MRAKTLFSIGLTGLIGAAATVACSVTFSLPTTAFSVTAFGTCNEADTYAVLTTADIGLYCGTFSCGSTAYALCNGSAWVACNCGIPSGYVVYTGPGGFGSGSSSSTSGGSGSTSGGSGSTSGGSGSSSGGSGSSSGGSGSSSGGSGSSSGGSGSSSGGSGGGGSGGGG